MTFRRAAAAAAASLLAACSGTSLTPAAGGTRGAGGGSAGSGPAAGGGVPGGSSSSSPAAPALAACSLLTEADVMAVAATFKDIKITVTAHHHSSDPPEDNCGFNQKGVFHSDGLTQTLSGVRWAQVTVVSNGADYAYEPAGNVAISGLGNGAYWEEGTHQVIVKEGQNVLKISDEVPVDPVKFPDLTTAYRQAAQALAVKIVSHL